MMGRILGNHTDVFTFHELHFFEQLWSVHDKNHILLAHDAIKLGARLFSIQRKGYFCKVNPNLFLEEANEIINEIKNDALTSAKVFSAFLRYETCKNNKKISCEQTPRNVFYISEILELYPYAKIINMVRDPRDVLLSQKWKWKRRFLGAKKIPIREAFRSWVNYHPVTISKLWNAAVSVADKYSKNERVFSLRFEDLLENSEAEVCKISQFLGISFNKSLLDIPQIGSSSGFDNPEKKGINKHRAKSWQKGGLNSAEIYLCQKISGSVMERHGYTLLKVSPNVLRVFYYIFSLCIKLSLAFVLNFKRMRNIRETIKRRLSR